MAGADYYSVFFPDSTVDTGSRFFFFSTLLSTPGEPGELGAAAQSVVMSGLGAAGQIYDDQGNVIIQQALEFLAKTIEYERQQEIAFFQEHIGANNNLTDKMKSELMSMVSGDSIDYFKFIALINVFFQGANEFKQNLDYEYNRLQEFNNELQKFKAKLALNKRSMTRKYGKKDGTHSEEQLFYMFNQYLADTDHNGLNMETARRLINTQTLTSRISSSLRAAYEKIWYSADWQDILGNFFIQNGAISIPNETQIKKGFTLLLLNQLIQVSRGEIMDILEANDEMLLEKGLPESVTNALAKRFMSSIKLDDDGNYTSDTIPLMTELAQNLTNSKVLDEIETVYDKAFKRLGEIKGTKKDAKHTRASISGLTKEAVAFLEDWLSKQSDFKANEETSFAQRRAALMEAMSSHLNIQITLPNGRKDYTQLAKAMDSIVKRDYDPTIKLTAKSPFLSELLAGQMEGMVLKILSAGFTNPSAKADNTFIEIAKVQLSSSMDFDKIAEEITNNYLETFNNRKLTITVNGHTFDEKALRNERKIKSNEYSIELETERRLASLEKLYADLQAELKADGATADEIAAALDELRNCFAVDTSVKNYDKLDNTQGFHGGSIGGSLEQQIENIYKMFSYGGISLPDAEWLMFAIYNCGPGLVGGGTGVKETIEDLFSTVAVMLLFEDAGEQAQYITAQASSRFAQPQRRILHLYNLNGSFFPQSFILQLTYNGLAKASSMLTGAENLSNGSRANIINPVNINNMVGKEVTGERPVHGVKEKYTMYKMVDDQSNWSSTFAANKGAVSIQITFLAGFLDILEKINDAMANLSA